MISLTFDRGGLFVRVIVVYCDSSIDKKSQMKCSVSVISGELVFCDVE